MFMCCGSAGAENASDDDSSNATPRAPLSSAAPPVVADSSAAPPDVSAAPPNVTHTESRAYDAATREYRLVRREIVSLCAAAAHQAADAAVDCSEDADLLEALDGRLALKAMMDAAGADGLPLSFGGAKRRAARKRFLDARRGAAFISPNFEQSRSRDAPPRRPKKKRKKKQQKPPKKEGPSAHADAPNPFPGVVDDKYWAQRFHYFSRHRAARIP